MSCYDFGIGLMVSCMASISGMAKYKRIAESTNLLMYLFFRRPQFDAEK